MEDHGVVVVCREKSGVPIKQGRGKHTQSLSFLLVHFSTRLLT